MLIDKTIVRGLVLTAMFVLIICAAPVLGADSLAYGEDTAIDDSRYAIRFTDRDARSDIYYSQSGSTCATESPTEKKK